MKYKRIGTILILCGVMAFTFSCLGFGKKSKKNTEKEQEIITENGKDYIKVPNPLYAVWQGQPEYVYVPKSQYRPLLGERIVGEDVRIKTKFLERKIARLEREIKSGSYLGVGSGVAIPANRIMKKKVVLLPIDDQTDSLNVKKRGFFKKSLSQDLIETKRVMIEGSAVLKTYEKQKWWAKDALNEDLLANAGTALGVQAFLKMKIKRLEIIHHLDANRESYKATISLELNLYDGLSGRKIFSATIGVSPDEIRSCQTPAEAEETIFRTAAKEVSQFILPQLSKLEWFTHVVRVDKKMVFIQGGRDDGLYVGDLLNVYDKPGREIFNQMTGEFLGREPGHFKGRLQVVEFFGVNAAITKPVLGESFKIGNFVKLAR